MAASKPTKKKAKKALEGTIAFQVETEGGAKQVVGIGNLRVMLFNDDGSWFAQGLEIDYFAQGSTRKEVQENFQAGLTATIDYHLREHGHIRGILQLAPLHVWSEVLTESMEERFRYFQVSWHDSRLAVLPFAGVDFYERTA